LKRLKTMNSRRINTVALLLVIATGLSWWLGDGPALGGYHLGPLSVLAVLGLSAFKGALIARDYMELRSAPALWRRAVMGWLAVVFGMLLIATLGLP
jgi:hypothetical protein